MKELCFDYLHLVLFYRPNPLITIFPHSWSDWSQFTKNMWRVMDKTKTRTKVWLKNSIKNIGVSNFNIKKVNIESL